MLVGLRFVGRMLVFMSTVLTGVLIVLHLGVFGMAVLMGVLVQMLVGVLMQVGCAPMPVLMTVAVRVFMGVQMFMFVLAFHDSSPPLEICSFPWKPSDFYTSQSPKLCRPRHARRIPEKPPGFPLCAWCNDRGTPALSLRAARIPGSRAGRH